MSIKRKSEPKSVRTVKPKLDPSQYPKSKMCSRCKIDTPLEQFNKHTGRGLYGKQQMCKPCQKIHNAKLRNATMRRTEAKLLADPLCFGAKKTCSKCQRVLHRREFSDDLSMPLSGKSSYCNFCCSVKQYKRNRLSAANILRWKGDNPCKCGEKRPQYIDICHKDRSTKRGNPAKIKSIPKQNAELLKCFGGCKVCHDKLTAEENGITEKKSVVFRREFVNAEKKVRGCCARCDWKFEPDQPGIFHFDHLPGEIKVASISNMVTKGGHSIDEISHKMAKCQLLCVFCHVDVTKERIDDQWRMFSIWSAQGDECIPHLVGRFKLSFSDIEEILDLKMYMQTVIEEYHKGEWIEFVTLE